LIIIIPVIFVSFNSDIMTAGIYRSKGRFSDKSTLIQRDGKTATISVHKMDSSLILKTNGKPDASIKTFQSDKNEISDALTQAALAFFPMNVCSSEYNAAIIGLCMDDDGITHNPEKRLAIAEKIIERALRTGIKEEDVIIDPIAMAVSADPKACLVTLETTKLVHQKLEHNITIA